MYCNVSDKPRGLRAELLLHVNSAKIQHKRAKNSDGKSMQIARTRNQVAIQQPCNSTQDKSD